MPFRITAPDVAALLSLPPGRRVVVFGAVLVHERVHGRPVQDRWETSAPVIEVVRREIAAGGAANVAASAAALGAECTLVTLVAEDEAGGLLEERLRRQGVVVRTVPASGRRTSVRTHVLVGNQLLVRVDADDEPPVSPQVRQELLDLLGDTLTGVDLLVLSDRRGDLWNEQTDRWLLAHRDELPLLAVDQSSWTLDHQVELLAVTGARRLCVLLDPGESVALGADGPPHHLHASQRPSASTAGANDTVRGSKDSGDAVVEVGELVLRARAAQALGHRVVMTNGCFDVLHQGHVAHLAEARRLGDLLVVAVNSDDSVRRLKGATRPVNTADSRMAVLAGLASVDLVVPFTEDNPCSLIELIRPDVYVKGGDYADRRLPEFDLVRQKGGTVVFLELMPDRSTSAIINRILSDGGTHSPANRIRPQG